MNFKIQLKQLLNKHFQITCLVLFVVLVVYCSFRLEYHLAEKLIGLGLLFLGSFFVRIKERIHLLWFAFFILLISDMLFSYFWLANHHFVLLSVTLAVLIWLKTKQTDLLERHIQVVLVVVILISVLQKSMSNQFMSGDFYYFMINNGGLFKYFINFSPEAIEIVKSNATNIEDLKHLNPNYDNEVILKDVIPSLPIISLVYAWFTIIFECIVGLLFVLKPKSKWTHFMFILMILGILCSRFETGFMSIMVVCGMFLCYYSKLRLAYILIAIGCVLFMITGKGYY